MSAPKARTRRYPTVKDLETQDAEKPLEPIPQEAPEEPVQAPPVVQAPAPFSALFDRSLPLLLAHEGGFVDHPADPGGATNLGISLRYAKTRGRMFDLDGDGDVDAADMRAITVATAAPAYHADFWRPVRADELPAGLGHAVFDAAVNSGPRRAVEWLQRAVGAVADGVIGPQTLAAAQRTDVPGAIERVCTIRLSYMQGLAGWTSFKRGWRARVERVIQEAHGIHLGRRA